MAAYTYDGPLDCNIDLDVSPLQKKTAIVTGGAKGLGKAYASALLATGATVIICDMDEAAGTAFAAQHPDCLYFVSCNVFSWVDQVRLFAEAAKLSPTGKIHHVVANAGIFRPDEVYSYSETLSEPNLSTIDVNVKGTLFTTKLAMHYFIKQNGITQSPSQEDTSLVLISSGAGIYDCIRMPEYCASKWAKVYEYIKGKGIDFATLEDAGQCLLRLLSDPTANGHSLFIAPRKWAPRGYVDLDLEDTEGTPLLKEIQAEQMHSEPVEAGLFPELPLYIMTVQSHISTTSQAPTTNGVLAGSSKHENEWYNQDFGGFRVTEQPLYTKRRLRMICVGAGATGLQIAYKAERILDNIDLQIYEKNSDIGGTWLENRYPGCTCDIPSHAYQFTWARNSEWSHFYSSSPEIRQYFKDIAAKFNLGRYIRYNSTVHAATWDEDQGQYKLRVLGADGVPFEDRCDILVSGSGILNSWKYPDIAGLDAFKGKLMHTADWDAGYDLTDKKVAVIGGGSSAVQLIPAIQPRVRKLTAFVRSAAWITTGFGAKYAAEDGTNFRYSEEQKAEFRQNPGRYDQYCRDVEGELNKRFSLMHTQDKDQLDSRSATADMMRAQLDGNSALTERLIPDFPLGCRRMTPGPGYLRSLLQDNVETVQRSVTRLTESGVVDDSGTEHHVDVVICATGFDTSFTPHFQLTGRRGVSIQEQFGDFPVGYLGITVRNFPNFFRKSVTWVGHHRSLSWDLANRGDSVDWAQRPHEPWLTFAGPGVVHPLRLPDHRKGPD
ncbi:hypothetical protein CLAIMM_02074 [Cladophialophora immunda]|nr:hypothetical protein CLAIMM_02074 [Cladophialophora immunda]